MKIYRIITQITS